MEVLSKIRIPSALESRTKMVLDSKHITSQTFMTLRPVYYRHCIPTEVGSVHGVVNVKLMPMSVPTYGRCRLNLRGFWIPYRLLMKNFDQFITNSIDVGSDPSMAGLPNGLPFFTLYTLSTLFNEDLYYEEVTDQSSIDAGAYDFKDGAGYYRFTSWGRSHLTRLESLGYKWDYQLKPSASDSLKFNALGLLALAKVSLDWYINQQYRDSSLYVELESIFNRVTQSGEGYELGVSDLRVLLNLTNFVGYDSNSYFISAWDSPVGPNPGNGSNDYVIDDISLRYPFNSGSGVISNQFVRQNSNGTPVASSSITTSVNPSTVQPSQYLLDSLKRLTDFVKRNQLVGLAIDRYLARYGVQLRGENIKRSVYCGFKSIDVKIGDVVSTADTSNGDFSNLGDRAGIGGAGDSFEFQYNSGGEYGVFLVLSSIIPDGGFVDGYDRNNRHLTRTDLWQPEFDSLGVMAIEKGEVVVFNDTGKVLANHPYNNTFGFAPSYAEYKVGRDFFTGDLRFPSAYLGGDSWTMFRRLQDAFGDTQSVVHSLKFTSGGDSGQYNRIFTYTGTDYDKFICVFAFQNTISSPARSLFDTYEFEQNGKDVTLDANGVKVN